MFIPNDGCDKSIKWTRLKVDMLDYNTDSDECIKRFLGNDVCIIKYQKLDVITGDDNVLVDVAYLRISDALVAKNGCVKYIKRDSLKQLVPNQNKYAGKLCNILINEDFEKYNKIGVLNDTIEVYNIKSNIDDSDANVYKGYDYQDEGVWCMVSLEDNNADMHQYDMQLDSGLSEFVCLRVQKIISNNGGSRIFDLRNRIAYIGKETSNVLNPYIVPIGVLGRIGKYNMSMFDFEAVVGSNKLNNFESKYLDKMIMNNIKDSSFIEANTIASNEMIRAILEAEYDNTMMSGGVKWLGLIDKIDDDIIDIESNDAKVFCVKDVNVLDGLTNIQGVVCISNKRTHPFVITYMPIGSLVINESMIKECKEFLLHDAIEWVKYKVIIGDKALQ